MFFEEDPFDRWCRLLVAYMVLMVRLTELIVWEQAHRLKVKVGYRLVIAGIQIYSFGLALYGRYLLRPLIQCGFHRGGTWADVEAYRLQLSAESGYDIPRPAALSEGLRQEQMRREV